MAGKNSGLPSLKPAEITETLNTTTISITLDAKIALQMKRAGHWLRKPGNGVARVAIEDHMRRLLQQEFTFYDADNDCQVHKGPGEPFPPIPDE